MRDELREALAELEHDQWTAWTRWQLANTDAEHISRWQRQMATPYADLSEREKDSDREWADKALAIFNAHRIPQEPVQFAHRLHEWWQDIGAVRPTCTRCGTALINVADRRDTCPGAPNAQP